jgi:hypothetical protein
VLVGVKQRVDGEPNGLTQYSPSDFCNFISAGNKESNFRKTNAMEAR